MNDNIILLPEIPEKCNDYANELFNRCLDALKNNKFPCFVDIEYLDYYSLSDDLSSLIQTSVMHKLTESGYEVDKFFDAIQIENPLDKKNTM